MTETPEESEPPKRSLVRRFMRFLIPRGESPATAVEEVLLASEDRGEHVEQKDMILRAARFDRLKVIDVMRPRADIVGIEAAATLGEAARLFSESQHSRLPIYGETLDDPVGFVHVRDVMALLAPGPDGVARAKFADRSLARIKRDILFVPPSMTLSTLFLKMQTSRIHLGLVVDEYGGTDGLISMEDLIEQIVGDIADEHDEEAPTIQEKPSGFDVDGRTSIEKLEAMLGASLALPEHQDEFDTVAGLAAAIAGRLPQRGEILHHPGGFDVEIVDADPRRVKRVRVKRSSEAAASRPPEQPEQPPRTARVRKA